MQQPIFKQIAVADVLPTRDNMRRIDETDPEFLEMVESVKPEAGGVRVPVVVRIHPKKKGKYELRYGERRWRACRAAGVEWIPAIVHESLTEAEALDLTYIENQFRKALTAQEEIAEIEHYMDRMAGDAEAIAKRIGKPKHWVLRRVHVVRSLSKKWKKLLETPRFSGWAVSHMILLARMPEHIQDQVYGQASPSWSTANHWTAVDLEEQMSQLLCLLSKSQWNLDDETIVPAAGACSSCSKRSGHQPFLWFDSDDQARAGDQCLDRACWESKRLTWLARRAKELRAKHPKLVLIAKNPPGRGCDAIVKNVGQFLSHWQYTTTSKTTTGAVPAMHVVGKGAGKLTYVKPVQSGSSSSGRNAGPTPLKEKRVMLECKRWSQVLMDLEAAVETSTVDQVTYKDKLRGIASMVAIIGNQPLWHSNAKRTAEGIRKLIAGKGEGELATTEVALWVSVKGTLTRAITWAGPITQTPQDSIEKAKWIGGVIGVDVDDLFKGICMRKGFTEPKSWKNLKADGTPKAKPAKKVPKGKKAAPSPAVRKKKCRVCGCTEDNACLSKGVPCHWVEPDLCSACHT